MRYLQGLLLGLCLFLTPAANAGMDADETVLDGRITTKHPLFPLEKTIPGEIWARIALFLDQESVKALLACNKIIRQNCTYWLGSSHEWNQGWSKGPRSQTLENFTLNSAFFRCFRIILRCLDLRSSAIGPSEPAEVIPPRIEALQPSIRSMQERYPLQGEILDLFARLALGEEGHLKGSAAFQILNPAVDIHLTCLEAMMRWFAVHFKLFPYKDPAQKQFPHMDLLASEAPSHLMILRDFMRLCEIEQELETQEMGEDDFYDRMRELVTVSPFQSDKYWFQWASCNHWKANGSPVNEAHRYWRLAADAYYRTYCHSYYMRSDETAGPLDDLMFAAQCNYLAGDLNKSRSTIDVMLSHPQFGACTSILERLLVLLVNLGMEDGCSVVVSKIFTYYEQEEIERLPSHVILGAAFRFPSLLGGRSHLERLLSAPFPSDADEDTDLFLADPFHAISMYLFMAVASPASEGGPDYRLVWLRKIQDFFERSSHPMVDLLSTISFSKMMPIGTPFGYFSEEELRLATRLADNPKLVRPEGAAMVNARIQALIDEE